MEGTECTRVQTITRPGVKKVKKGKNLLRFLKEDRGVVIDPHSHEHRGYNYTDVAPADIWAAHGLKTLEDSLIVPLHDLQNAEKVKVTDFTSLIVDWRTHFGSRAFVYGPNAPTLVGCRSYAPESPALFPNHPNPFNATTLLTYRLDRTGHVLLEVFDQLGRMVAKPVDAHKPCHAVE